MEMTATDRASRVRFVAAAASTARSIETKIL